MLASSSPVLLVWNVADHVTKRNEALGTRMQAVVLQNAFSTRLKLIWPRSSLKTTKMSKNAFFFAKSSWGQWVMMKFYLCLQNFAELWNLFSQVCMGNCCLCNFRQLFISLFKKVQKGFKHAWRYPGPWFLSTKNWNCSISYWILSLKRDEFSAKHVIDWLRDDSRPLVFARAWSSIHFSCNN